MTPDSDDRFISIPPYISTSWKNVRALRMEDTHLVITLTDGSIVRVPNLDQSAVESIFTSHAGYLQKQGRGDSGRVRAQSGTAPSFGTGPASVRFGFNPEGIPQALAHDPSQAHAPDLPEEILDKIASIAKILAPHEAAVMPKAEPHCNCVHCQIARAIENAAEQEQNEDNEEEEEVTEEDLHFREWDIEQIAEQVYEVANPFDADETFKVCLTPPGCTCGKKDCEHLLAVLRS